MSLDGLLREENIWANRMHGNNFLIMPMATHKKRKDCTRKLLQIITHSILATDSQRGCRANLQENPKKKWWANAPVQDPAGAARGWRSAAQSQAPVHPAYFKPGGSYADAKRREMQVREVDVLDALDMHSKKPKPLVSPKDWNKHGLQNSFGKMRTNLKKSKEDSVTVSSIGSPQKGITSVGSSWKATQIKPPTVPKIKNHASSSREVAGEPYSEWFYQCFRIDVL